MLSTSRVIVCVFIEEKNPLKQGLKQIKLENNLKLVKIEEKNPLKQGLKQSWSGDMVHLLKLLKRRIH